VRYPTLGARTNHGALGEHMRGTTPRNTNGDGRKKAQKAHKRRGNRRSKIGSRKEAAAFLLVHGHPVNAPTNKGMTPLHSATIGDHCAIARLLLENGANPNQRNSLGGTPLLYAALRDMAGTAKVLLEHGADPNIRDNSGGTPLHFAASSGSVKVLKLLLAHGANASAKDKGGKTPMDVATVETADVLRHYRGKLRKAPNIRASNPFSWGGQASCN
jgi:ankyrin repeat protein